MSTTPSPTIAKRPINRLCKFYLNGTCNKKRCRFSHIIPQDVVTLIPERVLDVINQKRCKGKCYCGSYLKCVPRIQFTEEELETKWYNVCSKTNRSMKYCKVCTS